MGKAVRKKWDVHKIIIIPGTGKAEGG